MLEESDLIQALAIAFGERVVVEQFAAKVEEASPELQPRMRELFSLYALERVREDGSFFLGKGLMSPLQAGKAEKEVERLCQVLGEDALELTAAFGIPGHMHHAPIANDWEEYNAHENHG